MLQLLTGTLPHCLLSVSFDTPYQLKHPHSYLQLTLRQTTSSLDPWEPSIVLGPTSLLCGAGSVITI